MSPEGDGQKEGFPYLDQHQPIRKLLDIHEGVLSKNTSLELGTKDHVKLQNSTETFLKTAQNIKQHNTR